MPSFDVHQHLWPEQLVSALSRRARPPRLEGRELELAGEGRFPVELEEHRLERRLALLDRDGIDVAVLSLPPTLEIESLPEDERAELLDAYHEGIRDVVSASGGRLLALAAGECRDGFVGACVSARELADGPSAEIEALLGALEARGQVLFVHPGPASPPEGAPAWWAPVVDYTAQMQAAYAAWLAHGAHDHPGLRVVFALLAGGAPFQLERLRSRGSRDIADAARPNVFFETASYGRRSLELCLSTYGVRQLLYGSDVPVMDPRATLHALGGFGDAVRDAIMKENPTLLFG